MATTTKTERLAQQVSDLLSFKYGQGSVTKLYDTGSNVYLSLLSGKALIKFEPQAAMAPTTNPVTGVANREFVPDVCRAGFDLGTKASGSVTAVAPDAAGAVSKATLTLTGTAATDVVVINGVTITAGTDWDATGNDNADAIALAAFINASVVAGLSHITAVASTNTVVLNYSWPGTGFNATPIDVTGSNLHIAKSGDFAGGTAGNKVAINGQTFESVKHADYVTIKAGVRAAQVGPTTQYFDESTTDVLQAASLAAVINTSVQAGIVGVVTAAAALAVVTVTAVTPGVNGNLLTFTETGSFTGITGAGFLAGGVDSTVSGADLAYLSAACALTGVEVNFYAKAGIAIADLVASNATDWFQSFRNEWGFINQQ
jgi:hypothetical protein